MMEFVNGKDDIPYMKWKIKFMFETTNQTVVPQCSTLMFRLLTCGSARWYTPQSPAKRTETPINDLWISIGFPHSSTLFEFGGFLPRSGPKGFKQLRCTWTIVLSNEIFDGLRDQRVSSTKSGHNSSSICG